MRLAGRAGLLDANPFLLRLVEEAALVVLESLEGAVVLVREPVVHRGGDADLDAHVHEDADHAQQAVAELQRREHGNDFRGLALLGVLDRDHGQDHERSGEHGHGDVHHQVHVRDLRGLRDLADERADENRRRRAAERVERRADHVQLVAAVAAAAEEVQHRVHDHVQHADREAANERAEKVDVEAERLAADKRERSAVATDAHLAGDELHGHAGKTRRDGDERRLLVAALREHPASGNAHEEVGEEVHHVAHHAPHVGAVDAGLVLPHVAHRRGQVRHERDHAVDEHHGDDRHDASAFLLIVRHCFLLYC